MLCALFIFGYAHAAGRVFHDDFESYAVGTLPTTQWGQEGGRTTPSVVSSSTDGVQGPHGGSKMARFNWDGPSSNYDSVFVSVSPLYSSAFFIRMWMRFDSNFDNASSGSGVHMMRFFQSSPYNDILWAEPSTDSWITDVWLNGSHIGTQYAAFPSPSSWHRFEEYVDSGAGVIKTWIDGALQINASGVSFGGQRYDEFFPLSNWGGEKPDSVNYLYIDDIEIFSDTGSGATGSMSDASIAQGGGSPPVVSGISCSPTSIQSPGTTDCTATASNTPTSYSWSVSSCSLATCSTSDTDSVATFTCQYGGPCDPCVIASNADGSSSQYCTSSAYLHVKVRKGGSITVH